MLPLTTVSSKKVLWAYSSDFFKNSKYESSSKNFLSYFEACKLNILIEPIYENIIYLLIEG